MRIHGLCGGVLSILLSGPCGQGKVVESKKTAPPPGPMVPLVPMTVEEGASVTPASKLLDWLNRNAREVGGKQRGVRVPVVFRFEGPYRMEIVETFIGTDPNATDKVELELSDHLGISLLDYARDGCRKEQLACVLWVEGYWRRRVLDDPSEETPGRWPFQVTRIGQRVAPGEGTRALLEPPR